MKLISGVLGVVASVLAFASAEAADMYRPEPVAVGGYKDAPAFVGDSWVGFYAGANAGYGWSNNNDGFVSPEGGFGGGQIGYNWQPGMWGRVVFGVEADVQASDISDDNSGLTSSGFVTAKSSLDWFGTARGRLGYAFETSLLYFTGGFAFGEINHEVSLGGVSYINDETATGYVLGGGLEHKFNPSWSAKLEYQYLNFGKNDPGAPVLVPGAGEKDDQYHTVRLGSNYHFSPMDYGYANSAR